jgi:hypothetical protein
VFSRRALPLAAWTNGLEIASVKADVERSSLVLETGVQQRWRCAARRGAAPGGCACLPPRLRRPALLLLLLLLPAVS